MRSAGENKGPDIVARGRADARLTASYARSNGADEFAGRGAVSGEGELSIGRHASLGISGAGNFAAHLDGNGGSIVPSELSARLGLKWSWVTARVSGGLILNPLLDGFHDRLAGASLAIAARHIALKVYAGRPLGIALRPGEILEAGWLPPLAVMGGELRGGSSGTVRGVRVRGEIAAAARGEVSADRGMGFRVYGRAVGSVRAKAGTVRASVSGNYDVEGGGWRTDAGIAYEGRVAGAAVSFMHRQDRGLEDESRNGREYSLDRGVITVDGEPRPGVRLHAALSAGGTSAGGDVAATLGPLTVSGYEDYSWGRGGHDLGGRAEVAWRPLPNVSLLPFVAAAYGTEPLLALHDAGARVRAGATIVYAPNRCVSIAGGGAYAYSSRIAEGAASGHDGRANITVAVSCGGGSDGAFSQPPSLSEGWPARGRILHNSPTILRPNGKALLKLGYGEEGKEGFSHRDHLSVMDPDGNEIGKGPDACGYCHSSPTLKFVQVDEKTKERKVLDLAEESCSCHNATVGGGKHLVIAAIVAEVAEIPHPVRPQQRGSCGDCHIDMAGLTKPTGGRGEIIKKPHRDFPADPETGKPIGHERAADRTCEVCHTGTAQYERRVAIACESCHDPLSPKPFISGSHRPQGADHVSQVRRVDIFAECAPCHSSSPSTPLDGCRGCHEGKVTASPHAGMDWTKLIEEGGEWQMKHARRATATPSGPGLCKACHEPQSLPPACAPCH